MRLYLSTARQIFCISILSDLEICDAFVESVQDAEVAFEDQQRINMFARKNVRLTDLKEEIDAKEVSDW